MRRLLPQPTAIASRGDHPLVAMFVWPGPGRTDTERGPGRRRLWKSWRSCWPLECGASCSTRSASAEVAPATLVRTGSEMRRQCAICVGPLGQLVEIVPVARRSPLVALVAFGPGGRAPRRPTYRRVPPRAGNAAPTHWRRRRDVGGRRVHRPSARTITWRGRPPATRRSRFPLCRGDVRFGRRWCGLWFGALRRSAQRSDPEETSGPPSVEPAPAATRSVILISYLALSFMTRGDLHDRRAGGRNSETLRALVLSLDFGRTAEHCRHNHETDGEDRQS